MSTLARGLQKKLAASASVGPCGDNPTKQEVRVHRHGVCGSVCGCAGGCYTAHDTWLPYSPAPPPLSQVFIQGHMAHQVETFLCNDCGFKQSMLTVSLKKGVKGVKSK